jgi:uncharacterized membrane protein
VTLDPLLAAPTIIQLHALAAVSALALGAVQLASRKGGLRHRTVGWLWAALIATVAVSSIWISKEQMRFGPFSWIHGLSALVLVMLPFGLLQARHGRIRGHRWTMISLFTGALVIAGIFTLAPGRIMGRLVFGN